MDFNVADLLGRTTLEARPYQQRLISKAIAAFTERQLRSVMIESPTGSGKTACMLLVAKGLQQIYPELRIGWFSMRRNLLAQAQRENEEKGINARIDFISMFDKEPPLDLLYGNDCTAKMRMVCLDEAQHDAANTMASLHSRIKADFILGCTATPFRTDCVKLCYDTVLKDAGLANLIQDGYLAQFHHYTIPQWGVKETTDCYLREPQKWGKSVFYWYTIDQCNQAAAILRDAGVGVEVVTGGHPRAREAQLDRFKAGVENGGVDVIMNCMVLTEGFDCPTIKTVFVRPACKGVTIQQAGRAFRKHRDVPFKQIVQAKKGWPFVKLVSPAEQYLWEKRKDVASGRDEWDWLSLKVNPHINALNCKMLVTLAGIRTEMPEYITKANKGRRHRQINTTTNDD